MIRERRFKDTGMSGGHWEYRIRKLSAGEEIPPGAISLPDDTPEQDWSPE